MARLWPPNRWLAKPAALAPTQNPGPSEPIDPKRVHIQPAEDADFLWLLSNGRPPHPNGWTLAPGKLETPRTLTALRAMNADVRDKTNPGAWLILIDKEVAGLCSYKAAPRATGEIEIGYGISESRWGRGVARAAIGLLIARSRQDLRIHTLTAQTTLRNAASQRVLTRHGFTGAGFGFLLEDGPVRIWRLQLR